MGGRRTQKQVQTVKSHGAWCCISSGLTSSPINSYIREHKKPKETGDRSPKHAASNLQGKEDSPKQDKPAEPSQSEDISSVIKQGYLSGVDNKASGNSSPFKIRGSPGRVSPVLESSALIFPPNYANLKSLLSTGLLIQLPSPPPDITRASPTLYEMITREDLPADTALMERCNGTKPQIMFRGAPGSLFNDSLSCDVTLTFIGKDGVNTSVSVHSHILAAHSRFFASKFSESLSMNKQSQLPHHIEISDCEDIEVYLDTLHLMYCPDLRKDLVKQSVTRVLGILKASTTILFEAGVLSCLEYLEAVPWQEEDEEKVSSALLQLCLESIGAGEVLKRLSTDDQSGSEEILVTLVHQVTKGTDEKARREMKSLVSRMLRENAAQGRDPHDLSKSSLYRSCQACFESLLHYFTQASSQHEGKQSENRVSVTTQIVRQADNLSWLVEILIDRQIADDFVKIWAFQTDLANLHGKVPVSYGRYEVSRLTARLCIALGKGQVLAPKEVRFMLLQNWFQPLIDGFGWMQRACKGLDKSVVEEGICQTILTLPLKQQQAIILSWFERFLKNGDDCPNLQRAFEIWWRRTFVRPPLELAPI